MNLGENIYRFRIQRNMSQGDLADALDVSRQSVSKWENNSATPELEKLMKMSELFGITLDELVTGQSPSPQPEPVNQEIHIHQSSFPPRKIVGTILLCAAFLVFLLYGLGGGIYTGMFVALPFAMCGIICFAFGKHTGLLCAWSLYFTSAIAFPRITGTIIQLPFSPRTTFVSTLFVQIPMVIYTVVCLRRYKIQLSPKVAGLYIAGWGVFLAYLALRLYATIVRLDWKIFSLASILNPLHFALFAALIATAFRIHRSE